MYALFVYYAYYSKLLWYIDGCFSNLKEILIVGFLVHLLHSYISKNIYDILLLGLCRMFCANI